MEAIILCGGLGTRLRPVIGDKIPKCMASIKGKPFLEYLLNYLNDFGIERVILATGYQHKKIEEYFGGGFKNIRITYSHEYSTLGTGGALIQAIRFCKDNNVFVFNGDSLFKCNLTEMMVDHLEQRSNITIATANKKRIFVDPFIRDTFFNCGVYVLNKRIFSIKYGLYEFSFENFISKHSQKFPINIFYEDVYFIDIGTPENYEKAQMEL